MGLRPERAPEQGRNALHLFLLFSLICQGLLQLECNQKAEGRRKWRVQSKGSVFLGAEQGGEGGE